MKTTYREAVRTGLREALRDDPRTFLMGEDVGRYGGAFACSRGMLEEFGPERVRDTPLSESTFVGAGIGAALGLVASVGAGVALQRIVYAVNAVDAAVVLAVTVVIGAVVVIATLGPALRAARTSPLEALRAE